VSTESGYFKYENIVSGLISIFEIENQSKKLPSLITLLINQSESAYLLRPNGTNIVNSVEQITSNVLYWPGWRSGPWIVAGRYKEAPTEITYSGPFIKDCRDDCFNSQVASLLKNFDWAIFSYFTTYHTDLGCLVASNSSPIKDTVINTYGKHVEISSYDDDPLASLRTATFYDYGVEGYFAHEVAKENGEKAPLLLCRLDLKHPDQYLKWNSKTDDYESSPWYEKYFDKLNLLEKFSVDRQGVESAYFLFQVNNEQAYLDIWSEASEDHSIAEATFSADTKLKELKSALSKSYFLEISKGLDSFSRWSYSQIYGGGADEHHAIFRSRDPRITQKLWQLVGKDQISRF